jgi:DNA polymerase
MDRTSLIEALHWQVVNGADEAIGNEPRNHLQPQPSPLPEPAKPPMAQPVATAPIAATAALAEAAATLEDLRTAIAAFDGLDVKHTATRLVFADGNPAARVMIVGEAPGSDEDRQGKPFVGVSGQLLDKMLAAIGLTRETVYITNVLNWRPPGNRKPTPQEVALSLPFLHRHIELIDPKLILLVGDSAAKALTGRSEGITRLRGRWLEIRLENGKTYRAMPTFHPSFLLRAPAQKREAWHDFLSLANEVKQII